MLWPMHLIDGKALATRIRHEIKKDIEAHHLKPTLAILIVGDDAASHLYVSLKQKAAKEIGINVLVNHREANVSTASLIQTIQTWNEDPTVHGILVQLPLPPHHDPTAVIDAIHPKKDVDGFHPDNVRATLAGQSSIISPTHEGILRLINESPVRLNGARVSIIANSDTFAAPLKRLLSAAGADTLFMHPDALDRPWLSQSVIVIIAIGRSNFLHASMTRPDATIIDVGTNKNSDGTTSGDVDTSSYQSTEAWITPVPGGVGPMTIALLLKQVTTFAKQA